MLSPVQPSPCHLSPLTVLSPPGDKPSQGHSSRDSAPHAQKPGKLQHTQSSENPSEEGTGAGSRAGWFWALEAQPVRKNSSAAKPFHCILVPDAPGSNSLCPCRGQWGPHAAPPCPRGRPRQTSRRLVSGCRGTQWKWDSPGPMDLLFISTPLTRLRLGSGRVNHLGLCQPHCFQPGWDSGVPSSASRTLCISQLASPG